MVRRISGGLPVKKTENFYRRDPSKALAGMVGLTLEERGVYNTVLDLLYSTWRPLEDDRAFIAGWCGCAPQKVNPIIRRLIEKGRLITFEEGGRAYLSDKAFEDERASVKGVSYTRSGRGQIGEKSGEVREKSEKVGGSQGDLLEKQGVKNTEKRREEKKTPLPPKGEKKARRKPETELPEGFPDLKALQDAKARVLDAGAAVKISAEAERFRNHAAQTDRRARDWMAAWRNWILNAIERAPSLGLVQTQKSDHDPWPARMRSWHRQEGWNDVDWGPEPFEPGCRVPPEHLPRAAE